jgi:hypothetical protein
LTLNKNNPNAIGNLISQKIIIMKNLIFTISIFLAITTLNSCNKKTPAPTTDANGLPFATQTGANTFGCLVDGVRCSVTGEYNWLYTYGMYYNLDNSGVIIKIITQNPRRDFYILCDFKLPIIGTHNVNQYVIVGYTSLNNEGGAAMGSYYANDTLPATITITKFSGNAALGAKKGDILSGTFDMILQDGAGKKIHVTEGRFDMSAVQ